MKKAVYYLVAFGLVASLVAPKKVTPKPNPAPVPEKVRPVNFVLGGSTPGGSGGIMAEIVGEAIRRGAPKNYRVSVVAGFSTANVLRLAQGKIDMSSAYPWSIQWAITGTDPYPEPIPLRALISTHAFTLHLLVTSGTGLTSITDMINKKHPIRVCLGQKMTLPQIMSQAVLEAYGITHKDIESWGGKAHFVPEQHGFELMRDRMADASFCAGILFSLPIEDLARARNVMLWPITEEAALKALEERGIERTVIPAGTYKFLKQDLPTVRARLLYVVRPELPEEVVYNVTKAICEQRDYLAAAHASFKELTPEFMTAGSPFIPFHPGAERYYREKGWLK